MLNFCDFIQVFVFTRNHHLKGGIRKICALLLSFMHFTLSNFGCLLHTRRARDVELTSCCRRCDVLTSHRCQCDVNRRCVPAGYCHIYFSKTGTVSNILYIEGVNCYCIKVVIITNLEQKQKICIKSLKIQQIFPKLYRCLLYAVFHNLKPQNAGLVDVKKDLNSKRSKGIFVRENLKNKHSY